MKYNDVFLDREFPARKSLRFIEGQNERLRTETVKSAGEIRALRDRLTRIESLARHALEAKPRDLEETWMRVEQIASDTSGE